MAVDYLRVKAERIAKGYTQDYMAKQLGWSDRARYAKRENGFVSFDADELAKVAEILGISKDDIGIFLHTTFTKKNDCLF
ncbi:Transcriptional regulator, Cro family [Streptococcus dysgalactiae subsp. equisimilis]|uniref:helix-turn-helix domain-containing protein n=1 Tax=Streptococcus dysgalactiae TaxID=1334 RepID=UPI0010D9D9DB|nr:helix-turn-helix transcriptional regulator [Streptococcus dysgalactiae]VTT22632.1 Transcriptional regulator, Cro family [Streptococcus dysgalactiae subsp. equisimilis]